MRHRKFTFKIGRTTSHRRAMLANAACSLLMEEQIRTTVTRAKQVRRLAEKMITLGKQGTLHARRRAIAVLQQRDVVAHLFADIASRYEARQGGYTRIIRIGPRAGDAAEMCILELIAKTVTAETEVEEAVANAEPDSEEANEDDSGQ